MMVTQLSFFVLTALVTASAPVPDLKLAAPFATRPDATTLPGHLFLDTLRVPFGDDWGGEMYLHTPLGHRLTLGVYLRAWSEAVCDRPSCAERAVESGVELRYRVQPGLDLGVGLGVQRSPGTRTAPSVLPRIHLKF